MTLVTAANLIITSGIYMAHIAAIGEVMVEFSPLPSASTPEREVKVLSYAGDTYNTSVYMARLGLQTDYVTRLGDDSYSEQILQRMNNEKIGTGLIEQLAGRSPGLYVIHNTPDGEREFFYWRKEAPARELFSTAEYTQKLVEQLKACDCVYFSGITLAIIGAQGRANLLQALAALRVHGVKIAFDSNFRPRLWQHKEDAQKAMLDVMQYADIALLTLDDELLLWGDDSVEGCIERYKNSSIHELILKRGADDTIIIENGEKVRVPVPPVKDIVDTTGAGDTFNAGYLAARLNGSSAIDAAKQGTRCAGIIIRHRGGVIDKAIFETELKA